MVSDEKKRAGSRERSRSRERKKDRRDRDRSKSRERDGDRSVRSKSKERRRSRERKSPKKIKDVKPGVPGELEEEEGQASTSKTKSEPLSLEELLAKKKAEEAEKSKPKFLTKEERAALQLQISPTLRLDLEPGEREN